MTEDIIILTFDNFIQKIKTIKTYRSNANKEYKVVKVNKTALVLRDQRTKADFEVPAAQVFAAMKELGIENCTVLKMRQYVGDITTLSTCTGVVPLAWVSDPHRHACLP